MLRKVERQNSYILGEAQAVHHNRNDCVNPRPSGTCVGKNHNSSLYTVNNITRETPTLPGSYYVLVDFHRLGLGSSGTDRATDTHN